MSSIKQEFERFTIVCVRCQRPLTARRGWVGRDVECPHCSSVLRVPVPPETNRPVRADGPTLAPKLQFNFGCPRCDTLLEGHTGMAGRPGRCPSCGARLLIPYVSPRTGRPEHAQLLEDAREDPTPVHAYAASGEQAPQILKRPDGELVIKCPRCANVCAVDAQSCPDCGTPFTMDAAPTMGSIRSESWSVAALVLGLVSLPVFFLFLPGVLAIIFGLLSLRITHGLRISGAAIAGLILGLISVTAGGLAWYFW